MSENESEGRANETRTDRRTVLQSLGVAGFGFPGVEGVGPEATASRSADDAVESTASKAASILDFFEFFGDGWVLFHRDYYRAPWEWGDPYDPKYTAANVQGSIAYLGTEWQDYGSPSGDGGCWKHTFMLTSLVGASVLTGDGTGEIVEVEPAEAVSKSILEIDVDEDDDNDDSDTDPDDDSRNVAVSVRRDEDLFGFTPPSVVEELRDETVEIETEDGTIEKSLLGVLSEEPDLGDSVVGYDRKSDEEIEAIWGRIDESALTKLTESWAFSIGSLLVGLAIGGGIGGGAYFLLQVVLTWITGGEYESLVEFDEGVRFEREYPMTSMASNYMMFDVFVAPTEDVGTTAGTVTVKDEYVVGEGSANVPNFTKKPMREGYAGMPFHPMPQWGFKVGGLPHPDELDGGPGKELFSIEPLEKDDGRDLTNVPVDVSELGFEPPDASFYFDPQLPVPGDTVEFVASDSTPETLSYDWKIMELREGSVEVIGSPAGESVAYTFDDAGTYGVELKITDRYGNVDRVNKAFDVEDRSVETAVAGEDGVVTTDDVDAATDHWSEDEPVSGTDDETISTEQMQTIVRKSNDALDRFETDTPWGED